MTYIYQNIDDSKNINAKTFHVMISISQQEWKDCEEGTKVVIHLKSSCSEFSDENTVRFVFDISSVNDFLTVFYLQKSQF